MCVGLLQPQQVEPLRGTHCLDLLPAARYRPQAALENTGADKVALAHRKEIQCKCTGRHMEYHFQAASEVE